MTPSRPYLVRALYEWINDNQLTPYIVVDATLEGVQVPQQYVNEGQIVLNISLAAVRNLAIDNEAVSFEARFGGTPMQVYVPMMAVMAIYARETGQGMSFGREPGTPPEPPKGGGDERASRASAKERPALKVVK